MTNDEQDQARKEDAREAMDRLSEQNRLLIGARMLPNNHGLSEAEHTEVRRAFIKYKQLHQVSDNLVAKEIGYSASVVSEWRARRYKGDAEEVTRAVNAWMERDARRRQATMPTSYVSTQIADDIRMIAFTADKRRKMAAIVAPSGCGKRFVAQALAEEMRGIFISCDETLSDREFLFTLAEALKLTVARKWTRARLKRAVVKHLSASKQIIFLDEAQQLSRAIGVVRNIYDQCGGTPIVLLGTDDVLKMVNDRRDGRGQFSRRCCFRYDVMAQVRRGSEPGDPGGAAAQRHLFSKDEVRRFFEMKKVKLSRDGFELAWALANLENEGSLGFAASVVEMAIDLNPDIDILQRYQLLEALDVMLGEEADHLRTKTIAIEETAKRRAMSA